VSSHLTCVPGRGGVLRPGRAGLRPPGGDAPHARVPAAVHAGLLACAGGAAAAPGGADSRRPARPGARSPQPADRRPQIAEQGGRDALRRRWADNIGQTRQLVRRLVPHEPLDAAVIDETEGLALRFLAGRAPLFDARIRDGRIVGGHGDLLAEDIFCLDDGPRILDCLDFDDRLRWLDGLDDAAFLAMDLERLGAPRLAEQFMAATRTTPATRHRPRCATTTSPTGPSSAPRSPARGSPRASRRPVLGHASWLRWSCGTCARARSP
jgi:hypothetical protein